MGELVGRGAEKVRRGIVEERDVSAAGVFWGELRVVRTPLRLNPGMYA